jgi:ADP-heptose:LPS heptosyltransferase
MATTDPFAAVLGTRRGSARRYSTEQLRELIEQISEDLYRPHVYGFRDRDESYNHGIDEFALAFDSWLRAQEANS